jgi:hypothetical protein
MFNDLPLLLRLIATAAMNPSECVAVSAAYRKARFMTEKARTHGGCGVPVGLSAPLLPPEI